MTDKKRIIIPKWALLIMAIVAWCALSFGIASYNKKQDYNSFISSIDDSLFKGNQSVAAYKTTRVQGNLSPVHFEAAPLRELLGPSHQNDTIAFASKAIMTSPAAYWLDTLPQSSLSSDIEEDYKKELTKWHRIRTLVEYFECNDGGFIVSKILKQPTGYNVERYQSKDMAYKIADRKWTPALDNGFGFVTPGRYISTGRITIQSAFSTAALYLANDEMEKSVACELGDIDRFPQMRSKYFLLSNTAPADPVHSLVPFATWRSKVDRYVENDQCIAWYSMTGDHYEVIEDAKAFYMCWLTCFSIGTIILFIGVGIYLIRTRFSIKVN